MRRIVLVSQFRRQRLIPFRVAPPGNTFPSVPQILLPEKVQLPLLYWRIPLQSAANILPLLIGVDLGKEVQYLLVRGVAQSPQERGDRNLALPVHFHRQHIPRAGVKLQPRPPGRDNLRRPLILLRSAVMLEIYSGRPHQLAYHHPLGSVDDKGAVLGHLGDVPHKDVLLLDLSGLFHHQLRPHRQRLRIGHLPRLALQRTLLRRGETVFPEVQLVLLAGVVGDGRNLGENIFQSRTPKPFVGIGLTQNEVRNFQRLGDAGIGLDRGRLIAVAVSIPIAVGAGNKLTFRDGSNGHAPISLVRMPVWTPGTGMPG